MAQSVKVTRWSQSVLPTETGLQWSMLALGSQPYRWSNEAGDTYAAHSHDYDKVIYVVEGSITFGLPEEEGLVTLFPGDRLDLPAGTLHDARVGPQGVICLEAHSKGE
jgi:quercetin dioxygenase-like cupin family protein